MSYNQNQYGYDQSNPYQQEGEQNAYEMNNYSQGAKGGNGNDDFVPFMNSIQEINNELDNYNQLIELIEINQKKLLNEVNEESELSTRKQLDGLISQASNLQQSLKSQIKSAQSKTGNDGAKIAQAENSRQRFLKYIQDYRVIEANYREQNKAQAARQFKIVQPDATDAEIDNAINDAGGQQIFSQALLNASRRGEAKTALAEVQERHRELQRLEKTMAELTQLFHDMEELVANQNVVVENVQQQVNAAQTDIEQGVGHTTKAAESARKARRKKCWCYLILIIIILIIIAVIVGAVAGKYA